MLKAWFWKVENQSEILFLGCTTLGPHCEALRLNSWLEKREDENYLHQ